MACLFCRLIQKELPTEIVYEDDLILVIKDKFPKAPVHLLMLPKKHIENLNTLDNTDAPLMGYMLSKIASVAHGAGIGEGYRTQIHTGHKGGQEIFHLHFHILGTP